MNHTLAITMNQKSLFSTYFMSFITLQNILGLHALQHSSNETCRRDNKPSPPKKTRIAPNLLQVILHNTSHGVGDCDVDCRGIWDGSQEYRRQMASRQRACRRFNQFAGLLT